MSSMTLTFPHLVTFHSERGINNNYSVITGINLDFSWKNGCIVIIPASLCNKCLLFFSTLVTYVSQLLPCASFYCFLFLPEYKFHECRFFSGFSLSIMAINIWIWLNEVYFWFNSTNIYWVLYKVHVPWRLKIKNI
jgi:hypothetical protein